MLNKPPIGVIERWLWLEDNPNPSYSQQQARIKAVLDAIERYRQAGRSVPQRWIEEVR